MATTTIDEAQGRLVEVEPEGRPPAEPPAPVGEEKTLRPYDPDQVLLMSPVLSEWVPEDDLAHFVSELLGWAPPMRVGGFRTGHRHALSELRH